MIQKWSTVLVERTEWSFDIFKFDRLVNYNISDSWDYMIINLDQDVLESKYIIEYKEPSKIDDTDMWKKM